MNRPSFVNQMPPPPPPPPSSAQMVPPNAAQGAPHQMPPQMPSQIPPQIPNQMPQQIPNQMPPPIPNQMPQQMPNQMPPPIPNQMPQQMPNQMAPPIPNQMPQQIPNQMPPPIPNQMPNQMPPPIPNQMPPPMPNQMPPPMPNQMPPPMPNQMPPPMPNQMPPPMPNQMPPPIPNQMQQPIHNQMQQPLPNQMPPQPISGPIRQPPPGSLMPPRPFAGHPVRMNHPMPTNQYGPPKSPNRAPMSPIQQSVPSPQGHGGVKRSAMSSGIKPGGIVPPNTVAPGSNASIHGPVQKKKKKVSDKVLPQKVRDLVPESQAYMDLIAFERKLDFTIMRKRMDIQEALKKPIKQKRKLRIFVTNTFFPGKNDPEGNEESIVPSWELRVEGRLLDDKPDNAGKSVQKRKFSSFFKSLVIELDKELYGPDNHLVEWHRLVNTAETDGFQVKRPGDRNVRCTILFMLDHQPLQYKLDGRLSRLLGIYSNTRPVIIQAFWQYIKKNRLQDTHEREYINCDQYLEQIFNTKRIKFAEIPNRLTQLLQPPDPIIINHLIQIEGPLESLKKVSCYDIDVEVDDTLKSQMQNFLLSISSQQEILSLEQKNHETVDSINKHKTNREFYLGFASDPQQFIHKWLISQVRDLKIMTDQTGNPEEERLSDFFYQPWTQEAVCRYFYSKVQQKRAELEQALGIRNT